MSETTHRRDISYRDFSLFAKFCAALSKFSKRDDELLWYLGEVIMFLPVWYKSAGKWRLSRYKSFRKEAIGIETSNFRRICRYIETKESIVIDILFRMSILSVSGSHRVIETPRYRQDFIGIPYGNIEGEPATFTGFVLEMRRCEGDFRGFRDDPSWYSEDIYSYYNQFSDEEYGN